MTMMRTLSGLCLCVCFLSLFSAVESKKLLFAHVLWRHGARSTIKTYPSSPFQNEFWTPGNGGQLIAQGMEEHVKLALKLRQRYVVETGLVSARYKSDEIYVRSSDYNRALVSAMSHMAAFYHGQGVPGVDYPYSYSWPSMWTPVPVHTVPWSQDTQLNRAACPRANDMYLLAQQTPEYQDYVNISTSTIDFLSNHSGTQLKGIYDAFLICDSIITEQRDNLPQGPWQQQILGPCEDLFAEFYNFRFGWNATPFRGHNLKIELPQAIGGQLLFEIIGRMRQKYENYLNGTQNPWISNLRYYAYSGHDSVLATLAALFEFEHIDLDRNTNPETSTAYSIELWIQDDNTPIVKVLYWRRDNPTYIDLSRKIGGCKFTFEACDLDRFTARSIKYQPPAHFDEFCQSRIPELQT